PDPQQAPGCPDPQPVELALRQARVQESTGGRSAESDDQRRIGLPACDEPGASVDDRLSPSPGALSLNALAWSHPPVRPRRHGSILRQARQNGSIGRSFRASRPYSAPPGGTPLLGYMRKAGISDRI